MARARLASSLSPSAARSRPSLRLPPLPFAAITTNHPSIQPITPSPSSCTRLSFFHPVSHRSTSSPHRAQHHPGLNTAPSAFIFTLIIASTALAAPRWRSAKVRLAPVCQLRALVVSGRLTAFVRPPTILTDHSSSLNAQLSTPPLSSCLDLVHRRPGWLGLATTAPRRHLLVFVDPRYAPSSSVVNLVI